MNSDASERAPISPDTTGTMATAANANAMRLMFQMRRPIKFVAGVASGMRRDPLRQGAAF